MITNKDIPMSMKNGFLASLIRQIVKAVEEHPEKRFIVGHGSGSFAHVPASKYRTIDGFINEESVLGMAIVQDAAAQLNRKVVYEFIKNDVPAVTLAPSNTLITADRKAKINFFNLLEVYLARGLFPVTYGDVVADLKQGCTIWSTEQILAFLAEMLLEEGYTIDSVVHVTEVAGFLDAKKAIVPQINQTNWSTLKQNLGITKGFDVTGGMALKIDESLQLARKGIKSAILSGLKPDNLYNYLVDKDWVGTKID